MDSYNNTATSVGNLSHSNQTIHAYNSEYVWPAWLFWTYGIYHLVAEFAALIFQATVLLTILCSKKLRETPSYYLIANLAVGDALWVLVVTPFAASAYFNQTWLFGETWCSISAFLCYTMKYQSLLSLALLAVDRYQALVHALHYQVFVSKRKYVLMCLGTWLYSAAIALPPVFGLSKYTYEQEYFVTCHLDLAEKHSKYSIYQVMVFIIGLFFPVTVVIFVSYGITYVKVRKALLSLSPGETTTERQDGFKTGTMKMEIRIAKSFVLLTALYFFANVPFVASRLAKSLHVFPREWYVFFTQMSFIMFTLPQLVNPILYIFPNKLFKAELKHLAKKMCTKA